MWETRSVFQGVWEGDVLVGFPHPVSFHSLGEAGSGSNVSMLVGTREMIFIEEDSRTDDEKKTLRRRGAVPWSVRFGAVERFERLPAGSALIARQSDDGSIEPLTSGWIAWTGAIDRAVLAARPMVSLLNWKKESSPFDRRFRRKATWGRLGPPRSIGNCWRTAQPPCLPSAPSDGSCCGEESWMEGAGSAVPRLHEAGICPTWRIGRRSWIASTLSAALSFAAASMWRCSTSSLFTVPWQDPGYAPASPRGRQSKPSSNTGGSSACLVTPSSTTIAGSMEPIAGPTLWAASSEPAWRWESSPSSCLLESQAFKPLSKATTAAGRPRSGCVLSTPRSWPSKHSPPNTSSPADCEPLNDKMRRRTERLSPSIGNVISTFPRKAPSSSCAVPTTAVGLAFWGAPFPSTLPGLTDSSEVRSICAPRPSGSTPFVAEIPIDNPCSPKPPIPPMKAGPQLLTLDMIRQRTRSPIADTWPIIG